MIKRRGTRYEHSHQGLKLGSHKHKADAELMQNALRHGVSREQIDKARKR